MGSWGKQFEKSLKRQFDLAEGGDLEEGFFSASGRLDLSDGPTSEALGVLGEALVANHAHAMSYAIGACQSPIEEAMLTALIAVGLFTGDSVQVKAGGLWDASLGRDPEGAPILVIVTPQFKIGPYRTDFLLTVRDRWGSGDNYQDGSIVLECDGHDYHERTKAQAKRDKKRDRELQTAGFEVHHFTGSEIWADPIDCAKQAIERAEARAIAAMSGSD